MLGCNFLQSGIQIVETSPAGTYEKKRVQGSEEDTIKLADQRVQPGKGSCSDKSHGHDSNRIEGTKCWCAVGRAKNHFNDYKDDGDSMEGRWH